MSVLSEHKDKVMPAGLEEYFEAKCGACYRTLPNFSNDFIVNANKAHQAIEECIETLPFNVVVQEPLGNAPLDKILINIAPFHIQTAVTQNCVSLRIKDDLEEVFNFVSKWSSCILTGVGKAIWENSWKRIGAELLWGLKISDECSKNLSKRFLDYEDIINMDVLPTCDPSQLSVRTRFEGKNKSLIQVQIQILTDKFSNNKVIILTVDSQIDCYSGLKMDDHFDESISRFKAQLENIKSLVLSCTQDGDAGEFDNGIV